MNTQRKSYSNIGDNVDTDVIIPARYLNTPDAQGAGSALHGGYRHRIL